jgi:hypothetical protein
MSELIRVVSVGFVHYRRKKDGRRWTHRALVMASRQMHLLDLIERELIDYSEAIEAKVSHQCWRSSGIYVATFFFAREKDALAFRARNYQSEYCVIAGPIRKPANGAGSGQEEVPGTGPQDDGMSQAHAGKATVAGQLVAQE